MPARDGRPTHLDLHATGHHNGVRRCHTDEDHTTQGSGNVAHPKLKPLGIQLGPQRLSVGTSCQW